MQAFEEAETALEFLTERCNFINNENFKKLELIFLNINIPGKSR
jgi:hypothetical protein